jgi:hypothetical protein
MKTYVTINSKCLFRRAFFSLFSCLSNPYKNCRYNETLHSIEALFSENVCCRRWSGGFSRGMIFKKGDKSKTLVYFSHIYSEFAVDGPKGERGDRLRWHSLNVEIFKGERSFVIFCALQTTESLEVNRKKPDGHIHT